MNPLNIFRASSFAPAFWCLGGRRRRALAAVYAFARHVDDVVDEMGKMGGHPESARRVLEAWRKALRGGAVSLDVPEPLWRELKKAMDDFSISADPLIELTQGVERDLVQTRYETWEDAQEYCYGVAGTVGLACLPIFGLDPARHREFAVTLGQSVQWVNILRDVQADILQDRLYIPREDLDQFGLTEAEFMGMVYSDKFRRLMEFEAQRARSSFANARELLAGKDRRAARPALVMGRLYEKLLDKLEKNQFRVFTYRPRLSWLEKCCCILFN